MRFGGENRSQACQYCFRTEEWDVWDILSFVKIFHHDDFEKSLSKAIGAFKVWAARGIPADWKFSKCVFGSNMSVKHLKMVLG